jgi:hypothetical protein
MIGRQDILAGFCIYTLDSPRPVSRRLAAMFSNMATSRGDRPVSTWYRSGSWRLGFRKGRCQRIAITVAARQIRLTEMEQIRHE